MQLHTHVPDPPLSHFVAALWIYEDDAPTHQKERALPTGTVELVLNLDEDLIVVLRGDPEADRHIKNARIVFRHGVGWDAPKLVESVRGVVGIR